MTGIEVFMSILGLGGTLLAVLAYVLLQFEKISVRGLSFSLCNAIGAFLVLVSLSYDFDLANIAGVIIEAVWMSVSIYGVLKYFRRKENA